MAIGITPRAAGYRVGPYLAAYSQGVIRRLPSPRGRRWSDTRSPGFSPGLALPVRNLGGVAHAPTWLCSETQLGGLLTGVLGGVKPRPGVVPSGSPCFGDSVSVILER